MNLVRFDSGSVLEPFVARASESMSPRAQIKFNITQVTTSKGISKSCGVIVMVRIGFRLIAMWWVLV